MGVVLQVSRFAKIVWENMRKHDRVIVLGVYILLAIAITLPFFKDPMNILISPMNGDAGYSSILFEAIKREGLNPFIDGYAMSIAYPDGIDINTAVNRVSFFSTLLIWFGTNITNAFFAHSLLALLGVLLSAIIAYLFVRKVTGSIIAGFVSGLILGFAPIMVATLFSANIYTYMGLHVLVIWMYWDLIMKGFSKRRASVTLLVVFLCLFWTPYYTFHILLVAGAATVVTGVVWLRARADTATFMRIGGLLVSLLVFAVFYYLIGSTTQYGGAPQRSVEEIYEQSASPLMYILPGATSIFGQGLHELLVDKVPRAGYTSLYLGVTTLILAALSLQILRVRSKQLRPIRMAVIICLAVAFVTFVFSLAPTIAIAGVTIPTPSYLIAEFVPSLRAGQRLVMPLLASVAVLAGIGLYMLIRNRSRTQKVLLVVLVIGAVVIDLASLPSQRYTTNQSKELFTALASRTNGPTAVYLHNSLVSNPGQPICYYQFDHKMPLINDCAIQRDPGDFDKPKEYLSTIIHLDVCDQIKQLGDRGIRYLIIAKDNNSDVLHCESLENKYVQITSDNEFMILEAGND